MVLLYQRWLATPPRAAALDTRALNRVQQLPHGDLQVGWQRELAPSKSEEDNT